MKLEPVGNWMVAKPIVTKPTSALVIDGVKNVTRCFLLEEVSQKAEAEGYKKGDIVVAKHIFDMQIRGHRCIFTTEEVVLRVHGVPLTEFLTLDNKPLVQEAAVS